MMRTDQLNSNDVVSAAEARELLKAAEQREAQERKAADKVAAEHDRAVEHLARDLAPLVAAYEKKAAQTLSEVDMTGRASLSSRGAFRALAFGQIGVSDLLAVEERAAMADATAKHLLGLAREGQRLVGRMIDLSLPVKLGEDDALVRRVDRCECEVWRSFLRRARYCATGEEE